MEQYLIPLGLILNALLILVNRWKQLSDWIYLPGLILGICLIMAGAFLNRT